MILFHPAYCHRFVITNMGLNSQGFCRRLFGSKPINARISLITPSVAQKSTTIPQSTTNETKLGIYSIVWTVFLNFLPVISFSSKARIIGAGKPIIMSYTFSIKVLRINRTKYISLKKSRKYLNPTQSLPNIPFLGA